MRQETAAANATAVLVRTGRTVVRSIRVEQRAKTAPVLYLQIFNNAAPTVGTTLPDHVIQIPAGDTNLDAAVLDVTYSGAFGGANFGTAVSYAATTTATGLTAPTAGQEPRVLVDYNQIGA